MNCLKCPIYWQATVDETKCAKCIAKAKGSEVKKNG